MMKILETVAHVIQPQNVQSPWDEPHQRLGRLALGAPSLRLLLFLVFALPTVLQAQFNYIVTNGTITITRYTGLDRNVTIPGTINGLTVTSIGSDAFSSTDLSSVTIPDGLTNIEAHAFYNCLNLTNVMIPDSVVHMGPWVFANCTTLATVTIPNGASNIGDRAFYNCYRLAGIKLSSRATSIGESAFYYCYSLTGITLPNGVTSIGDSAFFACQSLTGITLPNALTNIGALAFSACTNIPAVTIPNSVTTIGDWAFAGCVRVNSVWIGGGVRRIGEAAFGFCTSLNAIDVDPLNLSYISAAGVLFNKSQTVLVQCPAARMGSYAIPGSVTEIGGFAFSGCTRLSNVAIPTGVSRIGSSAFRECSSLTSITIPSRVTDIGDRAFAFCTNLTTITIPNNVTSIKPAAFLSCGNLTNATIGDSVTNVDLGAFQGCSKLITVTVGKSLTSIAQGAFALCTSLTGVYFDGNAPSVGADVFGGDEQAVVYYLPGTTGWSTTFAGRPTSFWQLPYPVIIGFGPSFGVQTNGFGFKISWATNASVIVEACADLLNPNWSPVSTNTLLAGTSCFTDSLWTNHGARFYRTRSPKQIGEKLNPELRGNFTHGSRRCLQNF